MTSTRTYRRSQTKEARLNFFTNKFRKLGFIRSAWFFGDDSRQSCVSFWPVDSLIDTFDLPRRPHDK
jgi:hypothetical protein